LYPIYIRGIGYLALGKQAEAIAEFQKILDHSGIVGNHPLGALARLGIARAYGLGVRHFAGTDGKLAKLNLSGSDESLANALRAYREFLELWKDADPNIPVFVQASAEYRNLAARQDPGPRPNE
jgi:tetratricopeptide (TPR) repeat protein